LVVPTDEDQPTARRLPPIDLICPRDRTPLEAGRNGYRCETCGATYPVDAGVVRFLDAADEFYEGRFRRPVGFVPRNEGLLRAWPLWLIRSGYVWAARTHIPSGSTVVEVGCASGVAYFAQRYQMIGADLSYSSLAEIAGLYRTCLAADCVRSLPLPDASVDGILSSYFWEHIAPEDKPIALAEYARVLRPGGKIVFLYDVENRSPIYRWMKRRDPARYREVLIDREGHVGWQTPAENLDLFEQAGFRVLEHRGKEKLLIAPAMYDKVRQFGGWVRPVARLGHRLSEPPWFQPYNGLLRILDETLCRLLPETWSRVLVSVCERT
jgi:SAM-dependent methyltransferase